MALRLYHRNPRTSDRAEKLSAVNKIYRSLGSNAGPVAGRQARENAYPIPDRSDRAFRGEINLFADDFPPMRPRWHQLTYV